MSELINSQVSADKDALVYFWKRKTEVSKNVRANKKIENAVELRLCHEKHFSF